VSTTLSAYLRAVTEVTIISAEQFLYSEFLMSLPDSTAFYSLDLEPLKMSGALEISPVVAFTIIDRMLGGSGVNPGPNRPLTEIELNVVDTVVKVLLENLTETWKPIGNVQFRIRGRETRPQMLQVIGLNEIVILLAFDISVGDSRGMLSISIPAAAIETMEEKVAEGWNRTRRQPSATEAGWLRANLGRVTLPVKTLLQTRMAAREVLALRAGDILSLGTSAAAPVDIHVGGVHRYAGRLTCEGGSTAVAIERLAGNQHDGVGQ
jgi:flagellar motor switch protein FliM